VRKGCVVTAGAANTAAVIDLSDADWRDPDGVLARAQRGRGHPFGWHSLLMSSAPGTRDKRTALRTQTKLGLHTLLLHGLTDADACTCRRGAECPPKHRGKHPVFKGWQESALDVAAIHQRLERDPRLNLGLRMGRQPGGFNLVTLDVDGDLSLLDPLIAKWGELPPTLTARTGSGGTHFLFRVSDEVLLTIKNRVKLSPGVDVRSTGGQIVAAPSKHYTRNFYEWIDAREPAVLP
jgi:hypothetical protein